MEYITAQEAARKWGISVRLVQKYCAGGRIRGVVKFGQSWGIPENAVKPSDPRGKKEKNQGTAAGGEEKNACVHAIEAFVTFVSSVLLHLPLPDSIPPTEAFYRICRRV